MYNQQLQTWQREAYEKYVNALIDTPNSEKELVQALEKFVPGSDQYDFLYLVTMQKLTGGKLSEKDKKLFQSFKERRRQGWDELVVRQQFLDYDISQTEEERKKFLGYICDEAILVNHFNHTKPYQVEHQGQKEGEESKEASQAKKDMATVNQSIFKKDLIAELEKNAKDVAPTKDQGDHHQISCHKSLMNSMPAFLQHTINFGIFNPKAVLEYAEHLSQGNYIAGIENQTFLAAIKKGMEARKKEYGDFEISREICDMMSLEQLAQLKGFTQGGTDPNVVGAFFSKNYCDELSKETQDTLNNEEKLNNLKVLLQAAKAQSMPKSLIQDFVRLILILGPKVNQYDKDIFKSFVKHKEFIMGGGSITNKIAQGIKSLVTDSHQNADWSHILRNLNASDLSYSTDDHSLAKLYLEHFAFLNGGVLDEFKNKDAVFIRNHMIEGIEDRVQIYLSKTGMQGLSANKRITAQLFQNVSEEVSLRFLPENKDKFSIQDQVELFLEVKNVSTVHIKVFEFNTLTYYRKTLKPFDTSIDLDGLESKITRKFEFNMPNNCKRKEKFVFEELAGRVGLFIFEFVGNGRSARAVVKKGSLSLIHRSTPAGHLAYIIDDSRNICKDPGTGLWLENKFYAAKEDGSIFINYSRAENSTKVIMVHGDFAQLGEFTRKTENFQVSCQFYLNEESVLVGGKAQIMVCPSLTINGRPASLKLLQSIVATVRTINYIDETPTTKKFENLKFNDDSDLTISFQVPPNLKNVNITLTCSVLNTTTKQMLDFSHGHQFDINDYSNSNSVHELHLKMAEKNQYELLYLGKNGEPMPNVPFTPTFIHAHYGQIHGGNLITDENGKIYLGELKHILSLQVSGTANKSWNIPSLNSDTWHYPTSVNLIAGSKFEVPVSEMWDSNRPNQLDRQQVTLVRSKQGIIIEDCFKKIQVVRKQTADSHYFLLQIENLEAGEYDMSLRGDKNHQIKINVHKGQFWNNLENFILKRTCIQELVQSQKVVKIQSSSINDEKTEIRLRLADFSKKARVHIFATHFLAPENYQLQHNYNTLMSNQLGTSLFTFAKWQNLLLSDRKLGDEYRYVFDRVHADRSLGNTLDRPSLLNKRIFTRKTEIDQENLQTGTQFAAQQESYMAMSQQIMPQARDAYQQNNYQSRMQNVMPEMREDYGSHSRGGGGERFRSHNSALAAGSKQTTKVQKYYITDFQNFIKDAPLIAFNLKPDQDGNVVFKNAKLSVYSTLNIIVVDENSVVQTTKNLNSKQQPAKRDLSLKKSLNENKGLTESRSHKCLSNGQSDFIEDITSSEIMLVDDLTKVNQIQSEIRKIMGMDSNSAEWSKLSFILQWNQLNKQTKDFYFGEYFSYELSFFLKRRDPAYFESVVRRFISNRMEKSFVDFYLLDDDKEVLTYQRQGSINLLNAFEKCLLLEVLVRNNQTKLAKAIASQMRDRVDANNEGRNTVENDNRIFDLVLNMNSTSKQRSGLDMERQRRVNQDRFETSNRVALSSSKPGQMQDLFGEVQQVSQMRQELGGGGLFDDDCGDEDDDFACDMEMEMEMMSMPKEAKGAMFGGGMAKQRAVNMATEKFEQLEATCEYAETYYFNSKVKPVRDTTSLVTENSFWCDYADFLVGQESNFVTPQFSECVEYRQSFLSQVLLDLSPETQASAHQYQADDSRGVTITAGSNLIAYKKEIKEVEVSLKQNFMVTHRYNRIDQYGLQNKSDDDDAIPKEFLMNVPYECEVIMTNVSPFSTDFNLLYQIPIGSMPMKTTKYMKSVPLSLSSYSTKKLCFQFYFPTAGKHGHYPSNVSIGETVTARGQFNTLNVVKRRNISQAEAAELNFDDLVQVGTPLQILDYLSQKSLQYGEKGFSFEKILFLMKDNDFWKKAIQILRQRQIYVYEIWAYACFHKNDIQALREFIMTSKPGVLSKISRYFTSSLFTVDPQQTKREFNRMLEYNPMINSRAHKVGSSGVHQILNKTFRQTFDAFLQTVAFKNKLDFQEKLIYVYYLQLQDRIPEAIKLFDKLERPEAGEGDNHVLEIQYDYLSAYFDFFKGAEDGYKTARRIVQRYDNYPVSHWKLLFLAIQDQLDEFDGEFDQMQSEYDSESVTSGSQASILERKQENLKNSKSKEPNLSNIQIDDQGTISIESVNIRQIAVKYYMIDAEVLFSRAPFLKNNTEEFSYVKPCVQTLVQMREAGDEDELMTQFVNKQVPLPVQLQNQNLVIEINGEGKQEFRTFYSCALKVHFNEAFGELKVSHQEKALGQVYVKVFMRDHSSKETFYRDGYTDIRGKFEYAVTSGDKLKSVSKFSILIQSSEFGSQIKEVNPPKDETIQAAPAGQSNFGAEGQMQAVQQAQSSLAYAKQNRMINRCNWVNSKKK